MLDAQVSSTKNIIYIFVLAIIGIVVVTVLLKNYVFIGEPEIIEEKYKAISANSARLKNKKLDTSFFIDDRYKALQDFSVSLIDLDLVPVGKSNPFVGADPEEVLKN